MRTRVTWSRDTENPDRRVSTTKAPTAHLDSQQEDYLLQSRYSLRRLPVCSGKIVEL